MRSDLLNSPLALLRRRTARAALALLASLTVADLHFWAGLRGSNWMASAHAQASINSTLAVVVVPPQKKGGDDAEAMERLLADAVLRLDVVRLHDLSPLLANRGDLVALEQVETQTAELVEDALRALLLRTPKRAQERLLAAIAKLKEAPLAGDERLYARLYKAQALALLATGELVPARDALVKSLSLAPKQTESEYAAYGNQARELFAAIQPGVVKGASSEIKVTVAGGRADIWVDGVWQGTGSAQAGNLPAGPHRITVRQSGMVADRRFVEVAAKQSVAVNIDLKPAGHGPDLEQGRAVLKDNFKQPTVVEDRMRELRNQLGADQLLVVRASNEKKSTAISGYFLGADGQFKKVESAIDKDEKYFDRIGEFVAGVVGAKLGPDPSQQVLDLRQSVVVQGEGRRAASDQIDAGGELFKDDKDVKKPITSQWWFWTAVAAGASLIGGGLYVLTSGDSEAASGAVGTVQVKLHKVSNP